MNNNPAPEPQPIKQPEHVAAGVYATAVVVSNTREEFFLDFLATYTAPFRLAARVILNPVHVKRLLNALQNNIELYRKNFGALPEVTTPTASNQTQIQDLYAQLTMPDTLAAGAYANNVLIRHAQEEFILDFIVVTHPQPVLAARVVVSPAHIQRIVSIITERVQSFESNVGPVEEPPESPEPPGPKPRFSLS